MPRKIRIIFIVLLTILTGMCKINARVVWIPTHDNILDLTSSSDPDYPCLDGSVNLFLSSEDISYTSDYYIPIVRFGSNIGLVNIITEKVNMELYLNTFLEISHEYFILWRANVGLYCRNELKLFNDDKNRDFIDIGIVHESDHYTFNSGYFSASSGDLQLDSFPYFPYPVHYLDYIDLKFSHQLKPDKRHKLILSIGGKQYLKYNEITSFTNSRNLELILEKSISKNNKNTVFMSLFYESISKNMNPEWRNVSWSVDEYFPESYWNEYIRNEYLSYFIIRIGLNLKNKSTLQPYLVFSSSNGRGLDFLEHSTVFGLGIRIFP